MPDGETGHEKQAGEEIVIERGSIHVDSTVLVSWRGLPWHERAMGGRYGWVILDDTWIG